VNIEPISTPPSAEPASPTPPSATPTPAPENHAKPRAARAKSKHASAPAKKLPRVPGKQREYFTANLAALSKAGLPVGWSLQTLQDNTSSEPLKLAIAQMHHDIDEGSPFWKALDRSNLVSAETLMLVRIG